jgi:hypothetical protein
MRRRGTIAGLAVVFWALAGAGSASAATLFAAAGGGAVPGCPQATPCSLTTAIAQADLAQDLDTVIVSGPLTVGATVDISASPIVLVGSGRTSTTIEVGAGSALRIGSSSAARELTARGPGTAPVVVLAPGGALATSAVEATAGGGSSGVSITGASRDVTLDGVSVAVPSAPGTNTGVLVNVPGGTVRLRDSTVRAGLGISHTGGTTLVQRSSVIGTVEAIGMTAGVVVGDSCILRPTGPAAIGLLVGGGAATLNQCTVEGAETSGASTGAKATGGSLTVRASIVRGFAIDLVGAGGSVTARFSDIHSTAGVPAFTPADANIDYDPRYRDPGSDYRLRADSPLVDAGGADALGAAESPLDRAGRARIVDGRGDGTDERDIGALEYQRPVARLVAPDSVEAARTFTLDATASAALDGRIVRYEWDLDGNGTFETDGGAAPTVESLIATPGTRTYRVRVTADDGSVATASHPVIARDTTKPRLSRVKLTPARLQAGRISTLRMEMTEPARLTLVIERKDRGVYRRVLTSYSRLLPAGKVNYRFITRRNGKALVKGTYRVTVTAMDPSRNVSFARSLKLTLV